MLSPVPICQGAVDYDTVLYYVINCSQLCHSCLKICLLDTDHYLRIHLWKVSVKLTVIRQTFKLKTAEVTPAL